jgi:hypothetical protein
VASGRGAIHGHRDIQRGWMRLAWLRSPQASRMSSQSPCPGGWRAATVAMAVLREDVCPASLQEEGPLVWAGDDLALLARAEVRSRDPVPSLPQTRQVVAERNDRIASSNLRLRRSRHRTRAPQSGHRTDAAPPRKPTSPRTAPATSSNGQAPDSALAITPAIPTNVDAPPARAAAIAIRSFQT